MKNRWVIVVVFWLIPSSIFCQLKLVDSLENILKNTVDQRSRVDLLNQLSLLYLTYQPKRALAYSEESLSLAKSNQYTPGIIVALNRIGESEFRLSNYAKAVDYVTQSLKLAEQNGDSLNLALAYRILGMIYTFGLKQNDLALEYLLYAYQIFAKLEDKQKLASIYGNITWVYASMNKNLVVADSMARLGIKLAISLGDKQLLSYNYNSLALILLQQRKLDSAIWYIDTSDKNAMLMNDQAVMSYNSTIKGNAFFYKKQYQKAIEIFENAKKTSKELNLGEVLKDATAGLVKCYEALGKYELAYQNYKLNTQLNDSTLNWATTQKILLTKLTFEEEKQKAKIAELENENSRSKKEINIFLLFFVTIFISLITVIILIARNNRNREHTNLVLQKKNDEIAVQNIKLEEANSIKDKFLSIIGHDLRSPLNSLNGLLGMVTKGEVTEKEFQRFAPQLQQHVIGVSETLENLLQWSRSQMEGWNYNETTFNIFSSIRKTIQLFDEPTKQKKITIANEIPENEMISGDQNQIELIFRNLIHNSVKFTPEGGVISIASKHSGEFLDLIIKDTGIGMSPTQVARLFQKKTEVTYGTKGERGTGLGLILVKEMIENHNGKIVVNSNSGKGTTFIVSLKAHGFPSKTNAPQ